MIGKDVSYHSLNDIFLLNDLETELIALFLRHFFASQLITYGFFWFLFIPIPRPIGVRDKRDDINILTYH